MVAASLVAEPGEQGAPKSHLTSTVIEAIGLAKDFGTTRALDLLDCRAGEGEVHGFPGPIGAAKSTTLRLLLGLICPTSDTARVFGLNLWGQAVGAHRNIADVPEDVSLWPNLSGGEVIDLLTGLRGDPSIGCVEN
ncbi:ATP-binding cassette domain-containing protein [Arthrobacter psychrolactophilus]